MSPADLAFWLKLAREHGVRSVAFEQHHAGDKHYFSVAGFEMFPERVTAPAVEDLNDEVTDEEFAMAATEGLPSPEVLRARRAERLKKAKR